MVTMGGWHRREGRSGRGRHRGWAPEVTRLESRTLQTINNTLSVVHVHPGLVANTTDGRQVPIAVYGSIASNHSQAPAGFFFVTDQYHADEPRGPVALTPLGISKGWYQYGFSFTVSLQAKRSLGSPNGREYNLFVGAKDSEGAGGVTVSVLVPKTFPPPPAHPALVQGPRALIRHGRR
jgi:hypothetical protein